MMTPYKWLTCTLCPKLYCLNLWVYSDVTTEKKNVSRIMFFNQVCLNTTCSNYQMCVDVIRIQQEYYHLITVLLVLKTHNKHI